MVYALGPPEATAVLSRNSYCCCFVTFSFLFLDCTSRNSGFPVILATASDSFFGTERERSRPSKRSAIPHPSGSPSSRWEGHCHARGLWPVHPHDTGGRRGCFLNPAHAQPDGGSLPIHPTSSLALMGPCRQKNSTPTGWPAGHQDSRQIQKTLPTLLGGVLPDDESERSYLLFKRTHHGRERHRERII